jgi:beta-glucosidase
MYRLGTYLAIVVLACGARTMMGQQKAAYLDPSLPPEQRAADLVHRMTLAEKASQLVNQARAIPRLNIPAYDWWSEALHGVMRDGTTEFPEPIGLAATFDTEAVHRMAVAIGTEGRIIHEKAVRASGGSSDIFRGLDFWAPNINIFRDPRWGPWAGDLRGRPVPHSTNGGCVRYRNARRRSEVLSGDFHSQALRCA